MIFELIGKTFGIFFHILKSIFDSFSNLLKNISNKIYFLKHRIKEDERHLNKYKQMRTILKKKKKLCDEI